MLNDQSAVRCCIRCCRCLDPQPATVSAAKCIALRCVSLQGGGVRVNNERIEDELHMLSEEDLIDSRLVLIAAGKKNKMLVRVA